MEVGGSRMRGGHRLLLVLAAVAALFLFSSEAKAAPGCEAGVKPCPPLLNQFGGFGSGAGQLRGPGGIAADPETGHIYVAEGSGQRISEFDSNGNFIKAWGWGVRDGTAELQVCTAETGCVSGQSGSGAGQFELLTGIALDEEGNIWSTDFVGGRLQKFSPDGEFVLMVGGEVNKTKVALREEQEANAEPVTVTEAEENLCTATSGDVCGEATSGTGQGQFILQGSSHPLAVGPDGLIYVGDTDRIQKFNEEGAYEGEIPIPGGGRTDSVAISPDGRLYVVNSGITHIVTRHNGDLANSAVVREIGPSGEELGRLSAEWDDHEMPQFPGEVVTDAEGNVYVVGTVVYALPVEEGVPPKFESRLEVVAFDDEGNLINFEPDKAGFGTPVDGTNLSSLATNVVGDGSGLPGEVLVGHSLFSASSRSYVRSYGRPFEAEKKPPVIEDQYATSVASDDASVEALINPRSTSDTRYQVEYGTSPCAPGSCEFVVPAEPAALGGSANVGIATGPVTLTGLEPGTTYHFRFRAENEVTDEEESGPVFGEEGTFRTFLPSIIDSNCPNNALRLGSANRLPDCRAYEMVSPIDKEGGEILAGSSVPGFPAAINQAAPSGNEFTYSSYRPFSDPDSAPYTSQYIARRDPGSGWSTEPISPPRKKIVFPTIDNEFMAFEDDLSSAWVVSDSVLAEGAKEGQRNLYRRDNGADTYTTECPAAPPQTAPVEYRMEPQGRSLDGSHLIFRANDKLTSDALAGVTQVYECVEGSELRLVGVLPGGEASPAGSSAGTAEGGLAGFGLRINGTAGAVSDDGSRIFWTAATNGPGLLYVRIGGTETVQIAPSGARFRMASPDGSRVLYTTAAGLFEASVEEGSAPSTQIAGQVAGFMGASEDTQLIYFASREDLDEGGPAEAGKPNLYLYRAEADSYAFIGELSEKDVQEGAVGAFRPVLTPVSFSPYHRSSRVSPDGLHTAFTSSASLTGYDNTDQKSGQADAEVFLYDAEAEELLCVSCNPSGARPRGANLAGSSVPYWVAAKIPGWENQFYARRVLSDDGSRLFFEAVDPLALGDTNGLQDVYQWEAPGSGTCTAASPTFSAANGGCIDLITTGKSPDPSEIFDSSPSGDDVFFKTASSLWGPDPGLLDVYNARVGGGFAPPPPLPPVCEGEACQPSVPAPEAPNPGTAFFVGPGNVAEKPKCRKGTHKVRKGGKVRCVKNKKAKQRKSRRGGR